MTLTASVLATFSASQQARLCTISGFVSAHVRLRGAGQKHLDGALDQLSNLRRREWRRVTLVHSPLLLAYVAKQYPNAMNVKASMGASAASRTGIKKGAEDLLERMQ